VIYPILGITFLVSLKWSFDAALCNLVVSKVFFGLIHSTKFYLVPPSLSPLSFPFLPLSFSFFFFFPPPPPLYGFCTSSFHTIPSPKNSPPIDDIYIFLFCEIRRLFPLCSSFFFRGTCAFFWEGLSFYSVRRDHSHFQGPLFPLFFKPSFSGKGSAGTMLFRIWLLFP